MNYYYYYLTILLLLNTHRLLIPLFIEMICIDITSVTILVRVYSHLLKCLIRTVTVFVTIRPVYCNCLILTSGCYLIQPNWIAFISSSFLSMYVCMNMCMWCVTCICRVFLLILLLGISLLSHPLSKKLNYHHRHHNPLEVILSLRLVA